MKIKLALCVLLTAAVQAAAQQPGGQAPGKPVQPSPGPGVTAANPFFEEWKTPFGVPPFDRIRPEHFKPAYEAAIAAQRKEIDAIVANPAKPTFANTVEALEDSGKLLGKVNGVFFNLVAAETNEAIQGVLKDLTPELSRLNDDISLNPKLFERVKAVWADRDLLKLTGEQRKLLDESYKGFARGGANLAPTQQERFRAINEELGLLSVTFADNLLAETNAYKLVIDKKEDLAGLPPDAVSAAAEAAKAAGLAGKWVFVLQPPSIRPFLAYADNRELRRQIWTAMRTRADHGDAHDNNAIAARMAALRAERSALLGYRTYADYALEQNMAKKADRVYDLMHKLWAPAVVKAADDEKILLGMADPSGTGMQIEQWDWRYWSEKLKKAKYDLDEEAFRPYFSMDRVLDGAFGVATRLWGVTFIEHKDIPVYHPEVRTFEVRDRDGSLLGIYLIDFFPRPGKRAGAWSGEVRSQWISNGVDIRPITVNCGSFTRPTGGKPALLSRNEVETVFHEFGHAMNSLFTRVRYQTLGNTPFDFGELASQTMEHWAWEPEVMKGYARHYQTGEPIPDELIAKMKKSETFNQAFDTITMVSTSLLDMDWHTLTEAKEVDAAGFEKASFARMGLPRAIPSGHRTPQFYHVFNGGYAAGYYSYLWCEVLDTDAFEAFQEKGIFDQATAASFRTNILERAGTGDLMEAWVRFRGREPVVEPLLKRRGLLPETGTTAQGAAQR
ncbi:MAG: M3 family metallopeptidase [Thermoanaerobaculaceae bacterium]|nr:M3 family metallopeptidase [Thermoanaerobaculaceae bacterium]